MSPAVRNVFFTFSMDVFPAVWRIFFTFSMNIFQPSGRFSSPFQWMFLRPSGMVSSILQLSIWSSPTFWRVFFSLLMKNEKEILNECIYLITLMLFRIFSDSFEGSTCFWLFLLLSVLSSIKQFTNFYNYEELWGLCTNSFPFLRYLLSQS